MLADSVQVKIYKSYTQPPQPNQNILQQTQQTYINPIIKHTLDSLPIIYGGTINRKRKYNLFLKRKLEFSHLISKPHGKNYLPNQRLYKKLNTQEQSRLRGYSCLQMNEKKQKCIDLVEQTAKTVSKKTIRLNESSDLQKVHQGLKDKRIINLSAMHILSKPRDKCNKQYCSCKPFYDQYQQEINKKMKQKLETHEQSKKSFKKMNLPKLASSFIARYDDQQSKHKVGFKPKINLMDQEQNQSECCVMCRKVQRFPEETSPKGILALLKKKQLEEKRNRLSFHSQSQNILLKKDFATQSNDPESQNQEYGIQTEIKKFTTVDQQINTEVDDEDYAFKYLQNNKNLTNSNKSLTNSQIKSTKKQPMNHLSQLKQRKKYQKKPPYQSKYQNKDGNLPNQYKQDEEYQYSEPLINNKQKSFKNKNPSLQDDEQDFNTSNQSMISQTSMINHLVNALSQNDKNRSTIFKLFKKKQNEFTENEKQKHISSSHGTDQKQKTKLTQTKKNKKSNLINEQTGLFSIPEEEEYADYLKTYKPIQKDFKIKNLVKSQNFKILKYKDSLYFGQTNQNNEKNGKALLISPKQIFQGIYQNDIKMSGCQRNIDGIYMGEFLNGQRHGQGKWIWNNGQIYEGEWRLGTKNGFGVWRSPKGDYYEGQWVMNRQQGKGIHKHKSSVYEGDFIMALKQGEGRQKYINGDEYIGQYHQGKPHGYGKYIWQNGQYYEGEFKGGVRQGKGRWIYSKNAFYEGEFRNDFKHGTGRQVFQNGNVYEGSYHENQRCNEVSKEFPKQHQKQMQSRKVLSNNQEIAKNNEDGKKSRLNAEENDSKEQKQSLNQDDQETKLK